MKTPDFCQQLNCVCWRCQIPSTEVLPISNQQCWKKLPDPAEVPFSHWKDIMSSRLTSLHVTLAHIAAALPDHPADTKPSSMWGRNCQCMITCLYQQCLQAWGSSPEKCLRPTEKHFTNPKSSSLQDRAVGGRTHFEPVCPLKCCSPLYWIQLIPLGKHVWWTLLLSLVLSPAFRGVSM